MPNEFASTNNPDTQGILKNYYAESPMQEALKRRRKKLKTTLLGPDITKPPEEEVKPPIKS